jgi:transposase-like protein
MWTKIKTNDGQITFITEMSDKPEGCPVCKTAISRKDLVETLRNSDGDVETWKFKCDRCKNNFVILND